MVDVLHILIQNRKWNLLKLFQMGQERDWGGDEEGEQNNVQCKAIQNYHIYANKNDQITFNYLHYTFKANKPAFEHKWPTNILVNTYLTSC
jgi:hypothetical protein